MSDPAKFFIDGRGEKIGRHFYTSFFEQKKVKNKSPLVRGGFFHCKPDYNGIGLP